MAFTQNDTQKKQWIYGPYKDLLKTNKFSL